jgi:dTDP-4-amino-4,6-dideoxygalactose transaminase
MRVPFLSLQGAHARLRTEISEYFESFYDSHQYILGPRVRQFEEEYARFSRTNHCIGVASGLDAITLALKALNIGPGHEVIVPSNTYIATWLAVSHVGATPVPVEPDPVTFNLDPQRIESAVTVRTRAIVPVHLFGQPCDMDAITSIADRRGLKVVEDNAQSQGASFSGRPTGSFGEANATSFYPTKNLGALGDAGAVTTDDPDIAEHLRALRNYGSIEKNLNQTIGVNSRLDELQAGVLSLKLRHLDSWNDERRRVARWYADQLGNIDELILPDEAAGARHVYHLFVIRTRHRDRLRAALAANGIDTMVHYPVPPHLQRAYVNLGYREGAFPIAEEIAQTSLSLPLFIGISPEQVQAVADASKDFFARELRGS